MFDDFGSYAPRLPDLRVRSIPDQEEFNVHKTALCTSEVFRDMFACCDQEYSFVNAHDGIQDVNQVLELDESASTLRLLLRLLHFPPPPPPLSLSARETRRMGKPVSLYEGALIPFPLLTDMVRLADKYGLSEPLRRAIYAHLFANASIHPLEVYAYATRNNLDDVAAEASAYLLHPPLSTYSEDQIALIPSVSAYHDLVRLHSYRTKQLKSILLREDIFPFGYGACVAHQENTTRAWNDSRMLLATQLDAATDLVAEMSVLLTQFDSCTTCYKACLAAIEMLGYKCNRIPRTIDYLPPAT
ncbi:hypothetical protein JVT61DRAFT_5809 [Boletus reticuloceps]|uniref:BTB domain-containing protein n=1 Tax=Boletus reticuloceps TaxID=495285 RepID=A0A8I3AGD4_9AGAM|nr:hypothetical protein JVT61DRAFT_5809 [Boletus reticuloceps]